MTTTVDSNEGQLMEVSVCYARSHEVWLVTTLLPSGSVVRDAIRSSKFREQYPLIDVAKATVGVYGKLVSMDHVLVSGDRVEIYRPLTFDPKVSRRRRAVHREKARHIKKKMPVDDLTKPT